MNIDLLACFVFFSLLLVELVTANTEKVIFQAPALGVSTYSLVSLAQRGADVISLAQRSKRKSLPVVFPTPESPRGLESWYLLRNLNPGQRYEVRVCWAASQPTEFWLQVFDGDSLEKAVSASQIQLPDSLDTANEAPSLSKWREESILTLRIQAAADFFSSNRTLMLHPPAVDVDIILDPYLWNVFPQSLGPTAVYIIILAIIGWNTSDILWRYLQPSTVDEKRHND